MELIRQEVKRFTHKDVTFLVKTRASDGDKLEIDASGAGSIVVTPGGAAVQHLSVAAFAKLVVRLFVVGWEGVTRDGKPAPYSYEALEADFPADHEDDVHLKLAGFIRENVDIFVKRAEAQALKKESPAPSTGSAAPAASPVPAGIA